MLGACPIMRHQKNWNNQIGRNRQSKKVKTKSKKAKDNDDSLDIVFVDEDVTVDKESELEARKAYLEEARSQESSGD